jgi:cytochrome c oxidase assembly protein subunit 11
MTTVPVRDPAAGRIWWLVGLGGFAIAMMLFFLFGYSAFYTLWCRITGTGLNPNNPPAANAGPVVPGSARQIEVFFEAKAYDHLPVRFYPSEPRVMATVGGDSTVMYRFKNLSDESVHFRPIHQVSPLIAGEHFSMKMCFCFNDQTIGPGQSSEFPVIFSFDDKIDERISSVTVRYSLHRIRDGEDRSLQQERIRKQLEAAGALSGDAKTMTPGFEGLGLPVKPQAPAVPVPQAPAASASPAAP